MNIAAQLLELVEGISKDKEKGVSAVDTLSMVQARLVDLAVALNEQSSDLLHKWDRPDDAPQKYEGNFQTERYIGVLPPTPKWSDYTEADTD